MNRQTFHAKNGYVPQHWHVVDATDQVLGRLSVRLATILMGKNKPQYTPHHDVGDFIVVINAQKIKLTGAKREQKVFDTYSGYPSGRKAYTYDWMIEHHPERVLERSVRRMLPKSRLGVQMYSKLKVYAGPDHPHAAQQPEALSL